MVRLNGKRTRKERITMKGRKGRVAEKMKETRSGTEGGGRERVR